MPRIREHTKTSSSIGAISAGVWSYKNGDSMCEIISSVLGGYIGGKVVVGWPDIIDRPTSPNHRAIGHGVLPNSALARSLKSTFFKSLNVIQQQVDDFKRIGTLPSLILSLVSKFVWGIIIGVVFGYGMHLLTDFFTENGLPLIC